MNNSLNTTTRGRYCEEWEGARHGLFQLANLCFAGAFLVPPKLQMNVLLMRSTLTVGFLLVTLWAGVDICAPDIFAWNVTFLFTNLLHSLFLLYRNIPPRIQPQLLDLFHKIFVPLKVDKKSFMDLVKEAEVISIKPEEYYAIEGATAADERLAVLLSGKMKATFGNLLLHYIHPNEFLDSPEWESCTVDSDKLFQVSISAVEPSRFLLWSRRKLDATLSNNIFLRNLMYNLIGKDITNKLYLLNEVHRLDWNLRNKSQIPDWWRHHITRSVSADAVHMGTKGHLRSLLWRSRPGSSVPPDSTGSTPFHLSRSMPRLSDPGPYSNLNFPCLDASATRSRTVWLHPSHETSLSSASSSSCEVPVHVTFETYV